MVALSSFIETVRSRRSVKERFIERPVEDDALEQVLEAETRAPSAHDRKCEILAKPRIDPRI